MASSRKTKRNENAKAAEQTQATTGREPQNSGQTDHDADPVEQICSAISDLSDDATVQVMVRRISPPVWDGIPCAGHVFTTVIVASPDGVEQLIEKTRTEYGGGLYGIQFKAEFPNGKAKFGRRGPNFQIAGPPFVARSQAKNEEASKNGADEPGISKLLDIVLKNAQQGAFGQTPSTSGQPDIPAILKAAIEVARTGQAQPQQYQPPNPYGEVRQAMAMVESMRQYFREAEPRESAPANSFSEQIVLEAIRSFGPVARSFIERRSAAISGGGAQPHPLQDPRHFAGAQDSQNVGNAWQQPGAIHEDADEYDSEDEENGDDDEALPVEHIVQTLKAQTPQDRARFLAQLVAGIGEDQAIAAFMMASEAGAFGSPGEPSTAGDGDGNGSQAH